MTENHGYEQPSQGTADWHAPLNDNFAAIDTDIEIRDTESAIRNDYTPKAGAKAMAIDTGHIFLGDGDAWTEFGVIPTDEDLGDNARQARQFGGTTGLLTANGAHDYDAYNLIDGTSRSFADAGAALQWLHDNASGLEGNPIIDVTQGWYRFDTGVYFTKNGTYLRGPSKWNSKSPNPALFQSTDQFDDANDEGIIMLGDPDTHDGGDQCYIRGLRMKVGDRVGILGYNSGATHIEHCDIRNVGPSGFSIEHRGGANCSWSHVHATQAALTESTIHEDGTNSFNASNVFLNSASPDMPVLTAIGDGWNFNNVWVNGVDGPNTTVPLIDSPDGSPGGPKRISWTGGGAVTGDAPALLNFAERVNITSVRFHGGVVGIRNMLRCNITNCKFENITGSAIRWTDGSGRSTIANNEFRFCGGGETGNAVIEMDRGRGYGNINIVGNIMYQNGADYSISLQSDRGSWTIVGNQVDSPIREPGSWSNEHFSQIANNTGHNPVLTAHGQPELPSSTGTEVKNDWGESAQVYHDGDGVFITTFDGRTVELPAGADASPVTVPPCGGIGFNTTTPSAWQWVWE